MTASAQTYSGGSTMEARRWSLRAALAVALAVLVTVALTSGCGSNVGSPSSSGAPNGSPKSGGSLTFAFQEEPTSLDPAVCWDAVGTQIEHQVYRGVIAYEPKSGAAGLRLTP